MVQKAREDGETTRSNGAVHWRGEPHQRTRQNIGEHEIEGLSAPQPRVREPGGRENGEAATRSVEARVGACDLGGDRIIVHREYLGIGQQPRCGNGEHRRAAAQVEDAAEAPAPS